MPCRRRRIEFTHGLYCDEFAEYQLKDIPVRQTLGGFLPSNGVGCGFERKALERLAESRGGRIFDPDSLTEDYENGFRLHRLGYRQIFVPVPFDAGEPIATREYFPRMRRAAVRQRSRWIAGIALQGWERLGWRAPWLQRYWFWRDRKGVVGSLLAPVANLTFVYGLIHWQPLVEGLRGWPGFMAPRSSTPWSRSPCACTAFPHLRVEVRFAFAAAGLLEQRGELPRHFKAISQFTAARCRAGLCDGKKPTILFRYIGCRRKGGPASASCW